jgi:coenzyme PQQ precursor peptide PqqA
MAVTAKRPKVVRPLIAYLSVRYRRFNIVDNDSLFNSQFSIDFGLAGRDILSQRFRCFAAGTEMGTIMEWTAPAFEEICLNCEINSYASAKL